LLNRNRFFYPSKEPIPLLTIWYRLVSDPHFNLDHNVIESLEFHVYNPQTEFASKLAIMMLDHLKERYLGVDITNNEMAASSFGRKR